MWGDSGWMLRRMAQLIEREIGVSLSLMTIEVKLGSAVVDRPGSLFVVPSAPQLDFDLDY